MKLLPQFFPMRALLKAVLLLTAVYTLSVGLANSVDGVQHAALFPVGIFGVCMGWALSHSSWPGHRAWELILIGGLLFIFIHVAQLWTAILDLARDTRDAEIALLRQLIAETPADFSPLAGSLETLLFRIGELSQRLAGWAKKPAEQDTTVLQFIWSVPVLLLAAWSAWALKKHRDALVALAPLLAMLGYILYYTHAHALPIQVELFILLLLMGISGWERYSPKRRGTRSEEKAATDTGMTLFLLALGLVVFAGLLPSLSAKEFARDIRQSAQRARNEAVAEKLGLTVAQNPDPDTSAPAEAFTAPALPNEHLVGIGRPSTLDAVVFTARTGELPPLPVNELREAKINIPRHYWRMISYDVYTGRGWATSQTESERYPADQYILDNVPDGYILLNQEIHKASDDDARLFWSGHLAQVDRPFQAAWRTRPDTAHASTDPLAGADMLGSVTSATTYHVRSIVPDPTEVQLRTSSPEYPQLIRQKYLALPDSLPQRVRQLAAELTADQTSAYDKARALEAYLRTYPYTLDVPAPPADQDIADYFLFELKKGYCDYYATTMVVMARSIGLPARLVAGFASGTYIPTTAIYFVRGADAHAWAEVYFDEIGWVEFEPTASQPEIIRPALPREESAQATRLETTAPEDAGSLSAKAFRGLPVSSAWLLLIFATALFIGLGAALYYARSHRPGAISPVVSIYKQLFIHGGKLAIQSPVNETPFSFSDRLAARLKGLSRNALAGKFLASSSAEIESIAALYVQEVYSPRALTAEDYRYAKRIWKKLYWRLLFARLIRRK